VQNPKSPSKREIARREKQRLRDLKKRKKEELEKFYNDQNAQIDADMVSLSLVLFLFNQ
jgi:SWI/SNF-related matrix-associated actin-dependent regulator of chromatin subfamily A member 5